MNRSTGSVQARCHSARSKRAPRHRSEIQIGFVAASACAGAMMSAIPANAGIITDRAFFDDIESSLIDFETDGDANPISLPSAQSQTFSSMEYASQGVVFQTPVAWTNDGNGDFDAAQAIGGSPDIAIPSSDYDSVELTFTEPVRAFGLFIVNNNVVGEAPTLTARDASGAVLETAVFGDIFRDGSIGIADYGFLGVFSDTPIASVEITKTAAIFDDFHMSPVPGPGGLGLLGIAGTLALRRRR